MRVESIERLLRRFTAFGGLALTVMAVLGLVRGSARPKGLVVGRPYSKVPFSFYVVGGFGSSAPRPLASNKLPSAMLSALLRGP